MPKVPVLGENPALLPFLVSNSGSASGISRREVQPGQALVSCLLFLPFFLPCVREVVVVPKDGELGGKKAFPHLYSVIFAGAISESTTEGYGGDRL